MVVQLGLDAHLVEDGRHLRAQVHEVVHRRGREVALLGAGLVPEVRAFVLARVPGALDRIDLVEAPVRACLEAHVVEHEELRPRTEVGRTEERRVGKEGVSRCRLRGATYYRKKNKT